MLGCLVAVVSISQGKEKEKRKGKQSKEKKKKNNNNLCMLSRCPQLGEVSRRVGPRAKMTEGFCVHTSYVIKGAKDQA